MQNKIKNAIRHRAIKILKKKVAIESKKTEYRNKFSRRTGLTAGLPKQNQSSPLHNHFSVKHCLAKASQISFGIWRSILKKQYACTPALLHHIEKPGSVKKREIMEFPIPDAALATVLNRLFLDRNLKRFSGNSFAYRPDRNQFDAIINLKQYLRKDKIFVIQYDFEQYFDNIPHWYITKILSNFEIISISDVEKQAVKSFLTHQYATPFNYAAGKFLNKRESGTPQGSSISLFLANLANDSLDKRIEGVNGQFVRYADDVVAIANTYEDAIKIEACFHDHCRESGLKINFKKSDGIRLLSRKKIDEIETIQTFKFLGYDFTLDGCAISQKSKYKIKQKLSRLIHIYLIHYMDKFDFNQNRTLNTTNLPFYDWDLMGLISEIRNYLYGGCSEEQIRELLYAGKRIPPMRGLMSFYALVDIKEDLEELDGWLVNSIRRALSKRKAILLKKYSIDYPRFTNKSLILGDWYDQDFNSLEFLPDSRLPSFKRGWRAARKYYLTFGLSESSPPPYTGY